MEGYKLICAFCRMNYWLNSENANKGIWSNIFPSEEYGTLDEYYSTSSHIFRKFADYDYDWSRFYMELDSNCQRHIAAYAEKHYA